MSRKKSYDSSYGISESSSSNKRINISTTSSSYFQQQLKDKLIIIINKALSYEELPIERKEYSIIFENKQFNIFSLTEDILTNTIDTTNNNTINVINDINISDISYDTIID